MVSIFTYPIKLLIAIIMSIIGFFIESKKLLEENDVNISGPNMKDAFNAGKATVRDTANEFTHAVADETPTPKPKPKPRAKPTKPRGAQAKS